MSMLTTPLAKGKAYSFSIVGGEDVALIVTDVLVDSNGTPTVIAGQRIYAGRYNEGTDWQVRVPWTSIQWYTPMPNPRPIVSSG